MAIQLSRLDHSFHYETQWDPAKDGTTKGGYLQGQILLPEGCTGLLLTCLPHEENGKNPHEVQPCFLHVVYMEGGDGQRNKTRRNKEKEPKPSFDNWIAIMPREENCSRQFS